MPKKLIKLSVAGMLLFLGACGSNDKISQLEDQLPFDGDWYNVSEGVTLNISEMRNGNEAKEVITLLDMRNSPATMVMAEATRENPDKITFEWNGKKGYAKYNRSSGEVDFFLAEGSPDESDLEYTFQSADRFDRLTVIYRVDPTPIYDPSNKEVMIDTLRSDQSVRLYSDSLGHYKVITDDGKLGVIKYGDRVFKIHGTPSDKAYEENYSKTENNVSTESYGFEKHGNQVLVIHNIMPADGSRALESYFVGEIDGPMIKVNKTIFDLSAAMDGDFSSAEDNPEPFTIFLVEPKDKQPYILINDTKFSAWDWTNPLNRLN